MTVMKSIRQRLRLVDRWQVRCTGCNKTRDASEVGIFRIALPFPKWTIGHCRNCGVRIIAIEPQQEEADPR